MTAFGCRLDRSEITDVLGGAGANAKTGAIASGDIGASTLRVGGESGLLNSDAGNGGGSAGRSACRRRQTILPSCCFITPWSVM